MLTVPRTSSALVTAIMETYFYGVYVVLFITSVFLLFTMQSRGFRERSIWLSPILCGGSFLFVTVTGHWILTIDRLFIAFVTVNDPVAFYGDFSQPTQIVQTGFLLLSLSTVDALFVHRLWTVWAHNRYVMIFPTLTLSGLVVCAIGVMYDFSQFRVGDSVPELANGWIVVDCALTASTNIYCTALIAWRLWKVQHIMKPIGGRTLMSVLGIIVESAALSAAWAVFFIITYIARSNLRFLIDVTPAIVGTTNMLIYVRVGLGWAHAPAANTTTPATSAMRLNGSRFNAAAVDSIDSIPEGREVKRVGFV